MIDDGLIATLCCPYCRSALDLVVRPPRESKSIDHGIVRCDCYEYPIVDGILVLRQTSSPADSIDEAAVAVRAGDFKRARDALIRRASMVGDSSTRPVAGIVPRLRNEVFRLGKRLAGSRLRQPRRAGVSSTRTPPVLADLQRFRPEGFVDYLYHRYANPSFVTSVPMMGLLEQVAAGGDRSRPAVLDLGCGTGHSTAMMGVLFPANAYVAADPDFVNLLLLRRHFAPDATCICLDAELPLPFTDSQFDAVFCLDAFHYIRSKWALVHELDRVVTDHGVWIFPHLHNAERCNPSPGLPLSAGGYLRIFDFLDAVLLDETTVLRDFVDERVLDVTTAPPLDDVTSAAAFSMFGSRRRGSGRRRFEIGQRLIEVDRAALGLNPIYEVTPSATTVELRMSWPDRGLEAECSMIRSIAPERLELDRDAWERINANTTDPRDEALIASLIETFVLVHLPPGYTHLVDAV